MLSLGTNLAAAGRREPVLELRSLRPLTVEGARFAPGERVRMHVRVASTREVRTTVTSRAGTFRVRFADVRLASCRPPVVVRVRGATGDWAILRCWTRRRAN